MNYYKDVIYTGDWTFGDFTDNIYENCKFTNIDLTQALLTNSIFWNCVFYACEFRCTDFSGSSFRQPYIYWCNFVNTKSPICISMRDVSDPPPVPEAYRRNYCDCPECQKEYDED